MTMIVIGSYVMENSKGKWDVYKRTESLPGKELVQPGLNKKQANSLINKLNGQ